MQSQVSNQDVEATMKMLLILFVTIVYGKECYWNLQNPYAFFGTSTPYDTVRGDMRDIPLPTGCEVKSVWWIIRHGNRNPSDLIIAVINESIPIKDEIIASYDSGSSQLCAQDVENFRLWKWDPALNQGPNYLTHTGYEELYNIAKRFGQKYHHLIHGTSDKFYFRPTNEERTISSCAAFVHGLTDLIPINVTLENPWPKDDVIRPFQNCERYQKQVKGGKTLKEQEESFFASHEFIEVQSAVQNRLGVKTALSSKQILGMYQLCRYQRPWDENLRSPWCAVFSNNDLIVMEYFDDVSHFYKKGYGSWVNVHLGEAPLKDLYFSFLTFLKGGEGKKVIGYFTHDTLMEMMFSALGLYFDGIPVEGKLRDPNRRWRCSFFGAYATNLMAVLNRCKDEFRVQLYLNENETPLCPPEGCSWEEFHDKFYTYTTSNLTFCDMSQPDDTTYRKSSIIQY